MKKKNKSRMLIALLFFFSALYIPRGNVVAGKEVTVITSDDTFATDVVWSANRIDDDWVILIKNCPGIWGFC